MECLALAGLPRVLAEPDADPVAILPGGIEQECVDIARVGGHVGPGDRGPRPGRFRQGRLRRLPSRRTADAGSPIEGRAEPRREGSRRQRAFPLPKVRKEGASGRFDQVAGAERITAHSLTGGSLRCQRGAQEWRCELWLMTAGMENNI